jgi:hypothetical protein
MKRLRPKTPFRLVLVEWEDSQRPSSPWEWLDEYTLPTPIICLSAGYLVSDGEHAIAVAPNLGDVAHKRPQACGIICIPKCSVRQIIDL